MTDETTNIEQKREQAGQHVTDAWREALATASHEVGPDVALMGMLMVSVEALIGSMGRDGSADVLDAMAAGLRIGEDITVTIKPAPQTGH